MDERAALEFLADRLPEVGDDAAVLDGLVLTTDMLHARADFPAATTSYTAGWRTVGASLSDVAAMGAEAVAAVAVYAAPEFDPQELSAFIDGAEAICVAVDARYVGGDLDHHDEFTAVASALGRTDEPVYRSGANPGDVVCVTGTLGRSAAALQLFDAGDDARANALFRFEPRVAAGRAVAPYASAMMDSSDGLARSLHQLAEASGCGFTIESMAVPIDDSVRAVATGDEEALELATRVGEDFELVFTVPAADVGAVHGACPVEVSVLGEVTDGGVSLDGEPLADEGWTHA